MLETWRSRRSPLAVFFFFGHGKLNVFCIIPRGISVWKKKWNATYWVLCDCLQFCRCDFILLPKKCENLMKGFILSNFHAMKCFEFIARIRNEESIKLLWVWLKWETEQRTHHSICIWHRHVFVLLVSIFKRSRECASARNTLPSRAEGLIGSFRVSNVKCEFSSFGVSNLKYERAWRQSRTHGNAIIYHPAADF